MEQLLSHLCINHGIQNIMNKSHIWQRITAYIIFLTTPLLTHAQQSPKSITPPPPELEKLEEGQAPTTIPRKPGETQPKITEKREKGHVTEIKVQKGNNTYYVKPLPVGGASLPGDIPSAPVRGAQWQVKEFDLGEKQHQVPQEGKATDITPAPPPQAVSPK